MNDALYLQEPAVYLKDVNRLTEAERDEILKIERLAYRANERLYPISAECRAIVTIPVYKEFADGRIQHLLRDLAAQNTPISNFEVLLIVNNSHYEKMGYYDGYRENRELLNHLDTEHQDGRLLNVQGVDFTLGELPARDMGRIRGVGNFIAAQRFASLPNGRNYPVIQLDADAGVDNDFVTKITAIYASNNSLLSSSLVAMPLPIHYTSEDFYLLLGSRFIKNALNIKGNAASPLYTLGPTIAFRSGIHALPSIKKYVLGGINDDLELGINFANLGGLQILTNPRVYIGDRDRLEGFDAPFRKENIARVSNKLVLIEAFKYILGQQIPKELRGDNIERLSSRTILELFLNHIISMNPDLSERFIEYLQEEEDLVSAKLNIALADQNTLLLGHIAFVLGRLILDRQLPWEKANVNLEEVLG